MFVASADVIPASLRAATSGTGSRGPLGLFKGRVSMLRIQRWRGEGRNGLHLVAAGGGVGLTTLDRPMYRPHGGFPDAPRQVVRGGISCLRSEATI